MNNLVLCTGNSARSILAEVLINSLGAGRFRAYSAGGRPAGQVNPGALAKLEREGLPTAELESKHCRSSRSIAEALNAIHAIAEAREGVER